MQSSTARKLPTLPLLQIIFTGFCIALLSYNIIVNSGHIRLILTSVPTGGKGLRVRVLQLRLDKCDAMARYTICVVFLLRLGDTRAQFRKRVTSLLQCL